MVEPDHARLHRLEGADHDSTVRCLTRLVLAHGHGMEGWEAPEWQAPWRSDTPTDPPE
jgi:hypothetical protein